jgi:Protein of unknown function (FYDLN_acid)
MSKQELGTKRLCGHCGAKFYDLHLSPITCPKCGTAVEIAFVSSRFASAERASVPGGGAETSARKEVQFSSTVSASPSAASAPEGPKRSVLIVKGSWPSSSRRLATCSTKGVGGISSKAPPSANCPHKRPSRLSGHSGNNRQCPAQCPTRGLPSGLAWTAGESLLRLPPSSNSEQWRFAGPPPGPLPRTGPGGK